MNMLNPVIGEDATPQVVGSEPAPGQRGISRTQPIKILFNKEMDPQKCIAAFNIQPSTNGLFEAAGAYLVFTPNDPYQNGTYVFRLSNGCEDLEGRDIEEPYSASFAVGSSASADSAFPTLTSLTISAGTVAQCLAGAGSSTDIVGSTVSNGCTANPTNNPFVITFSEAMNQSLTESAISISPSVSGAFSWDGSGAVLTFTPDAALTFGERYDITIATTAADSTDQAFEYPVSETFVAGLLDSTAPTVSNVTLELISTASADACVAPANDSVVAAASSTTDVCVDVPVLVNFSEDMDQQSVLSSISFSPSVDVSYSWSATNQLTITPLGTGFASNTVYSLSLSTGATDLAGNAIATNFGLSFTTENTSPRVVGVGLESQNGGSCDAYNPPAEPLGGNNTTAGANCWWVEGTTINTASSYPILAGSGACNTDTTTDNVRLIFNKSMNPAVTLGALSLTRYSSPVRIIKLSQAVWSDSNRVLTLSYAEDANPNCGTATSFGGGDLDLYRQVGVDNLNADAPLYIIELDTTAKDDVGNSPASTFAFAFVGN